MIQDEWIHNLLLRRPDLQPEALARTAVLMNEAIEDSLIENFEHLIDSMTLPDPGDRHVLAAAVASQSDAIVTFNIKDFASVPGVDVWHPDDFLVSRYAYDAIGTLNSISALRQRLKNPPKTAHQLIATYERQGLPLFSRFLQKKIDLI
ncbi:PIN domain-containing protein [Duganella sp. CT11-25]|uniref:PIN domain-containing protein n=1 Tax=unclassified Duganella TaxID=2636909 RepID=UPI0039B0F4A8